jgi:hypothetical protein
MKLNFKHTILLVAAFIGTNNALQAQFTGSNPIQQSSAGNVLIGYPNYVNGTSILQVRNGAVTFDGTTGNTPVSGAGTRLMWIPAKAAFRAGIVTGNKWDDVNLGFHSFAVGYDNQANGQYSFACGNGNTALGTASFVCGNSNNSVGNYYSFVTGSGNTVTSPIAGFASGMNNNVSGSLSVTFGKNNISSAFGQFTIGQYCLNLTGNTTGWNLTEPLFVVGNGSPGVLSNALTMLKNGNTGFGISNPVDRVSIGGTLRMNNNNIYLSGDANHGLGYYAVYTGTGNYASYTVDGPVLYGYKGGALGTNQAGNKNIALSWLANGNVGIGTSNPGSYRLAIEGKAGAREFVVTNASWADFVFESDFNLKPLNEIKKYIEANKHLPEIPTAVEIEKNGLNVGEIQAKQMQKIEELTLYIIQQNERIELLEKLIKGSK